MHSHLRYTHTVNSAELLVRSLRWLAGAAGGVIFGISGTPIGCFRVYEPSTCYFMPNKPNAPELIMLFSIILASGKSPLFFCSCFTKK